VIRHIPHSVPALESLNLPPVIEKMTDLSRGLILFTGETGSGKSTSLAAFVDKINKKYHKHIVTIEDPIEYVYTPNKSIIDQREIKTDAIDFQTALNGVFRQTAFYLKIMLII
jgi:twitching motility protein PilT